MKISYDISRISYLWLHLKAPSKANVLIEVKAEIIVNGQRILKEPIAHSRTEEKEGCLKLIHLMSDKFCKDLIR